MNLRRCNMLRFNNAENGFGFASSAAVPPPFPTSLKPTMSFSRRSMLRTLLSLVLMTESSAVAEKPNIIFILVDDQGYYDLGCYGASEAKTPRIDAMAKAGTRFTDYYSAAPVWASCLLPG